MPGHYLFVLTCEKAAGTSSTATPTPSATTTGVAQTTTPSSAPSNSDSSNNNQRTTAIAVGVVVPVVVIGLALGLLFFYRRHARSKQQHVREHSNTGNPLASSSVMGVPVNKMLKKNYPMPSPQHTYAPASELPAAEYHVRGVHELVGGEVAYEAEPET